MREWEEGDRLKCLVDGESDWVPGYIEMMPNGEPMVVAEYADGLCNIDMCQCKVEFVSNRMTQRTQLLAELRERVEAMTRDIVVRDGALERHYDAGRMTALGDVLAIIDELMEGGKCSGT